jgi:hypothetical protein
MHARIDGGSVKLLTRTGLDWSHRYRRTIEGLRSLPVKTAYLDGELCALNSDGVPVFSRLQAAMDEGRTDQLVFFAFDLLFLNGESTAQLPLIQRKERLQGLFRKGIDGLRYSEHVAGDGPRFRAQACKLGLEGAISKRADRPYAPGDRGIWVKSKCLNREEFVVVGWTDPEGSRSHIGALLLGYYTADDRLHYAGRAGTGMTEKEQDNQARSMTAVPSQVHIDRARRGCIKRRLLAKFSHGAGGGEKVMFELKTYLAFLLKATVLVCAAILCVAVLYHAVRITTSRQARADLMYSIGLASSPSLPPNADDDALWSPIGNESTPIVMWVQFCAGIEDPYRLPMQFQPYFVAQARPQQDGAFGRTPHRIERGLLELNVAVNKTRFAAAKRAQAAFDFWQAGSLIIIVLGAASTVMIGLSSTEFGRESGSIQQVMRTLAIVFPALSTAATAAIAFYGPQTEWSQSSATAASLSQLHSQIATTLQVMECGDEPPAGKSNAFSSKVGEWTQKYQEIVAATNATRQGSASSESTKKDGANPGR